MDKNIEILLNSQKNIASVNVDTYDKIELSNTVSEIMEYDVNEALNSTEVFDAEREANPIYRIYGRIEYLSLLNGIKTGYPTGYKYIEDFFNPQYTGNSKNIFNSFKFYLVKPATGYTQIFNGSTGTTHYIRYFEVIATPNDFELYLAGFANNVYGEQTYAFSFKKDFDVSQYFDNFGFPITELFLYAQYVLDKNGSNFWETMKYTKQWTSGGIVDRDIFSPPISLNIGDHIKTATGAKIGDLIDYQKSEFIQTQVSGQTIYIETPYLYKWVIVHNPPPLPDIFVYFPRTLIWKFNPLIPLRLRYLANELNSANTGSTSYDVVSSIPSYATKIDNDGNYVWREIVPQGYTEPLTGLGVDYPFLNKRRYLFATIILSVMPDLTDNQTLLEFQQIWYSRNAVNKDITPQGDLNNIEKPCQ